MAAFNSQLDFRKSNIAEVSQKPSVNTQFCIRRPLCSTLEDQPILSQNKILPKLEKKPFMQCNFLVPTLQCFNFFLLLFDHKNLKKPALKVAQMFFSAMPTSPNLNSSSIKNLLPQGFFIMTLVCTNIEGCCIQNRAKSHKTFFQKLEDKQIFIGHTWYI